MLFQAVLAESPSDFSSRRSPPCTFSKRNRRKERETQKALNNRLELVKKFHTARPNEDGTDDRRWCLILRLDYFTSMDRIYQHPYRRRSRTIDRIATSAIARSQLRSFVDPMPIPLSCHRPLSDADCNSARRHNNFQTLDQSGQLVFRLKAGGNSMASCDRGQISSSSYPVSDARILCRSASEHSNFRITSDTIFPRKRSGDTTWGGLSRERRGNLSRTYVVIISGLIRRSSRICDCDAGPGKVPTSLAADPPGCIPRSFGAGYLCLR